MPKPLTRIGQFICVEGKVHNVYESLQMMVQNIGELFSSQLVEIDSDLPALQMCVVLPKMSSCILKPSEKFIGRYTQSKHPSLSAFDLLNRSYLPEEDLCTVHPVHASIEPALLCFFELNPSKLPMYVASRNSQNFVNLLI